MQDYHNLKIWQTAHEITLNVYKVTKSFPQSETLGLSSQLRRAAASIPENIAEGCGRGSDADFSRFLYIAMGSTNELEYELLLAKDLQYISEADFTNLNNPIREEKQMLTSLIKKLKAVSG
jgi:four helix bundle protein